VYSGADHKGWNDFWSTRGSLSISQLSPFFKNFAVMMGIIDRTGNAISASTLPEKKSKSVLEVGAGRGTLSELFNQKGYRTFATDLEDRTTYPKFPNGTAFVKNDILDSKPFGDKTFDITFTYGLLEHFNTEDKIKTIKRCLAMTKRGGVSIHYIVPKKWTNLREDGSVYRDSCDDILREKDIVRKYGICCRRYGKKFVFPVLGSRRWECSNFLSKGFMLWFSKHKWSGSTISLDEFIAEHVMTTIKNHMTKHNSLMEHLKL